MGTADDQHFLDILSSFPNDVQRYSLHVAEVIDRGFDNVALAFRQTLSTATWIPEAARPAITKHTTIRPPPRATVPVGYLASTWNWIDNHRALTVAFCTFFGTGGFLYLRQKRAYARKRRAKRSVNGARKEVVVVAGTPNAPITRSVAWDLERRGFIVYVVVSDAAEENGIRAESRNDIHPLHLNVTDSFDVRHTIEQFKALFAVPDGGAGGEETHELTFAGIVVIPDVIYPAGPIETLSPELWSDVFNAKVLNTIATTQAFLRAVCERKARILILTPGIVSSLQPPFHSVESTVVRAIEGFTTSLTAEMATLGVDVCQFKLGSFDIGNSAPKNQVQRTERADVLSWSASARAAYAQNYIAQKPERDDFGVVSGRKPRAKGSSLRELNNAIFDALTQARPRRVWRVGQGSVLYDVVGRWVPPGIVGWMMGMQSKPRSSVEDSMSGSAQWEKVERIH